MEPVAIALIEFPKALLSLKYPSFTDQDKKKIKFSNNLLLFFLLFLMTFSPSDTEQNLLWKCQMVINFAYFHPLNTKYIQFSDLSSHYHNKQASKMVFVLLFLAHRKSQPPSLKKQNKQQQLRNMTLSLSSSPKTSIAADDDCCSKIKLLGFRSRTLSPQTFFCFWPLPCGRIAEQHFRHRGSTDLGLPN